MDIVKRIMGWLGTALFAFVAACGGSGGDGGGGGAPPPTTNDPQARSSVGAAGGEVTFPDQRFKLTIPAGALGNTTEIVITELSADNVPASLKPINADKVYRLEPSGTQFAMPVAATVQLPASASGAIAVMLLDSNGTSESPASQQLTLASSGRTLIGQVTHFSDLAVKTVDSTTARIDVMPKSLKAGEAVTADVTLAKTETRDQAVLGFSQFTYENLVERPEQAPPPSDTRFPANVATTIAGRLFGICKDEGPGKVRYHAILNDVVVLFEPGRGIAHRIELFVADSFVCGPRPGGGGGGTTIPTGVFKPPLLTKLDGIYTYTGRFANLEGDGPTAFVAGAEGAIAIDLVSRSSKLNWTISGPEGNVLGSPLLGALPVKQPGDNADATVFGFRNNGTAKRPYDPASSSFVFTEVGFDGVRDATTTGGGIEANSFIEIAPTRGIRFYEFDPATRIYRGGLSALGRSLFSGELVSGFLPQQNGYVLGVTRLADNGTKSRVYGHVRVPSDAPAVTLFDDDDPQARRMRCAKGSGVTWSCGVSYAGGKARLFNWDPTQPTATPATQSVTTGAGSLGIDVARKANGNAVFVVANFTANNINVIETSPDVSTVIGNWQVPAPEDCANPAHPALVWDSTVWKFVVTCNGSDSLWVGLLPQG